MMTASVKVDGENRSVKDIYLNINNDRKDILIAYENVQGQAKIIYKRKPSRFTELDVELGPGTHVIPTNAIGCAFQARLQPVGGNVQIIAAGMPYNFQLNREGGSGYAYHPSHSYHMLFPSANNPEEIRYLEIGNDNNSNIRLKKWFITEDFSEGFSFWKGFKETQISLAGGTHLIPDTVIGCIYKAIPQGNITIDHEFDTKPLYYDRPRWGGGGHGHDFGITGMLFFPYKNGNKATQLIINPAVGAYNLNVIAWLEEAS